MGSTDLTARVGPSHRAIASDGKSQLHWSTADPAIFDIGLRAAGCVEENEEVLSTPRALNVYRFFHKAPHLPDIIAKHE